MTVVSLTSGPRKKWDEIPALVTWQPRNVQALYYVKEMFDISVWAYVCVCAYVCSQAITKWEVNAISQAYLHKSRNEVKRSGAQRWTRSIWQCLFYYKANKNEKESILFGGWVGSLRKRQLIEHIRNETVQFRVDSKINIYGWRKVFFHLFKQVVVIVYFLQCS